MMQRVAMVFSVALIVLVASCASSAPSAPADEGTDGREFLNSSEENGTVAIEGIPTMYGSAPRTYVVIVVGEGEHQTTYYVHPDYQDDIKPLTGGLYRFTGTLVSKEGMFDAHLHDYAFLPESWKPTAPE